MDMPTSVRHSIHNNTASISYTIHYDSTQETQTFAEIISSLIPVNLILFD